MRSPRPPRTTKVEVLKENAALQQLLSEERHHRERLASETTALKEAVTEALEQQTAASEILRVISTSPTDLQPVFETIAENAVRLCDAAVSGVLRFDGALIHLAAYRNFSPAVRAIVPQDYPMAPTRRRMSGRAILDRAVVHAPDVLSDPDYPQEVARSTGWRSFLSVPMLREGQAIGAVTVVRIQPGPFSDRQIELLKTFADQAVIAIENVRLFNETKEALEQQTATSEILRVISSSPTDVQPVFDTIARSAAKLCDALGGNVQRFDGELMHLVASHNWAPEGLELARRRLPIRPTRSRGAGRAVLSRAVVHIPDVLEDPEYSPDAALAGGWRTILSVPMLREGNPVGAITVTRAEAGPFSKTQLALLQTFADQAVIAIENVRLFTELQASNRELTESLDRQTATAEILRVISRSGTDVQPVFDAIAQSAQRLLRGWGTLVMRLDGELLHLAAVCGGAPGSHEQLGERFPQLVRRGTFASDAVLDREAKQIADVETDNRWPEMRANARERGWRAALLVPMLLDGKPIGVVTTSREAPGAFPAQEVELLKTFADQAVIAIENARLLTELQARTQELTRSVEQLTALGEVGRAVSSTLDLETVLTTIVSRAVQLSGLDGGVVHEYDEDAEEFVHRAQAGTGGTLAATRRGTRIRKGEGVLGQTAITLEPVQVPDITVPGAYLGPYRDNLIASGIRAILSVPMVREGRLIGSLGVTRNRPGEFPAETIELLRTFATQSALAIQNARLFHEIADKSRQLEAASRHKSEFLANMSHELRTPLNAIIGFSEVLAERMFGEVNAKQAEYLQDILESGRHLLSLINDILDLSKIEAGRMELEGPDFDLPSAIDNALILVRERATRCGITLVCHIDEGLGTIRGDERKVKQVLLNLLSNALKFTPEGGRIDVRAALNGELAEVSVADTGVGIAPADQAAVFEEFRQVGTADKKVEGTGLGLALSQKFVQLHGGRLWVESEPGRGSTFTFTLPVS